MAEIEKVRGEWRKFCAKRERPWNAWYPPDHIFEFAAAFAQQERDDEREAIKPLLDAIEAMRPFVANPHNIPWNNILHHAAAIRARGEKGRKP